MAGFDGRSAAFHAVGAAVWNGRLLGTGLPSSHDQLAGF